MEAGGSLSWVQRCPCHTPSGRNLLALFHLVTRSFTCPLFSACICLPLMIARALSFFLFSWCIGHPLPCRRVKYSCCNPHYTEMTLWQGCVCVCLSVSSCFTCGCSCEMSPSQRAASSQLPHVTRGRAGEHQVIDGKKRHGKTVSSANVPLETEPSEQSAPGNHSQQPLFVAVFSLQHPRPIPPPAAR